MDTAVSEGLVAMAIGRSVLANLDCHDFICEAQSQAVHLLEEVRQILDDDTLDDPECFYKIDAIVSAFRAHGVDTSRHDFG